MSDPKELDMAWFEKGRFAKMREPRNLAKTTWKGMSSKQLLGLLDAEVVELKRAIRLLENRDLDWSEKKVGAVVTECFDIANYANMIADCAHHLLTPARK